MQGLDTQQCMTEASQVCSTANSRQVASGMTSNQDRGTEGLDTHPCTTEARQPLPRANPKQGLREILSAFNPGPDLDPNPWIGIAQWPPISHKK